MSAASPGSTRSLKPRTLSMKNFSPSGKVADSALRKALATGSPPMYQRCSTGTVNTGSAKKRRSRAGISAWAVILLVAEARIPRR